MLELGGPERAQVAAPHFDKDGAELRRQVQRAARAEPLVQRPRQEKVHQRTSIHQALQTCNSNNSFINSAHTHEKFLDKFQNSHLVELFSLYKMAYLENFAKNFADLLNPIGARDPPPWRLLR